MGRRLPGVVQGWWFRLLYEFSGDAPRVSSPPGSGVVEQIVGIKDLNYTGNTGMWMGIDNCRSDCGGMITSTIDVLILVPVFLVLMKERALGNL